MLWAWNVDIFVRLDLRGWAPPATHYHFNHCARLRLCYCRTLTASDIQPVDIPVSFSDYQGHWKIAVASLSVNKISTDTAYSFSRYVVAEPLVILQICYLWRTEYMQCAHLYSQYIPAVFYLPVLLNDIVLQWFDTLMSTEFDVCLFFRLCSWQRRQRYFRIYWSVLRVKMQTDDWMLLTVVNRLCFYLLFITMRIRFATVHCVV